VIGCLPDRPPGQDAAAAGPGRCSAEQDSHCCLTVGNLSHGTFVERWNGRQWTADNSPFSGGTPGYFVQVCCLSASSCAALAPSQASFWNGSSWRTGLTP
jgi:hypothetical protein